jgi:hypothetical protein
MRTGFWFGDLREGDNFKDVDVDRGVLLQRIFKK